MYVLWCMHYVFGVCNPTFTVFYGQILVWFGINCILQGTIELILRDDFEQVRYLYQQQIGVVSKSPVTQLTSPCV